MVTEKDHGHIVVHLTPPTQTEVHYGTNFKPKGLSLSQLCHDEALFCARTFEQPGVSEDIPGLCWIIVVHLRASSPRLSRLCCPGFPMAHPLSHYVHCP